MFAYLDVRIPWREVVEDYTAAYGAIGAAIVAMLWFYVSNVAILIGAELNAVIEDTPR